MSLPFLKFRSPITKFIGVSALVYGCSESVLTNQDSSMPAPQSSPTAVTATKAQVKEGMVLNIAGAAAVNELFPSPQFSIDPFVKRNTRTLSMEVRMQEIPELKDNINNVAAVNMRVTVRLDDGKTKHSQVLFASVDNPVVLRNMDAEDLMEGTLRLSGRSYKIYARRKASSTAEEARANPWFDGKIETLSGQRIGTFEGFETYSRRQ